MVSCQLAVLWAHWQVQCEAQSVTGDLHEGATVYLSLHPWTLCHRPIIHKFNCCFHGSLLFYSSCDCMWSCFFVVFVNFLLFTFVCMFVFGCFLCSLVPVLCAGFSAVVQHWPAKVDKGEWVYWTCFADQLICTWEKRHPDTRVSIWETMLWQSHLRNLQVFSTLWWLCKVC